MDLARMRADGLGQRVLAYAREHRDHLPGLDQDALSAVLGGNWQPLHPRWNCMNSVMVFDWAGDLLGHAEVSEARRRPGIRHFEGRGPNKPWHLLCERDLRELYREHRRATPWPRVRPTGLTPANVMRRLVRA
jgi:lipopolysaccharide biosynthesis glycosyltransferase